MAGDIIDFDAYRKERFERESLFKNLEMEDLESFLDGLDDEDFEPAPISSNSGLEVIAAIDSLARIEKEGRSKWLASNPVGWSNPKERSYLSVRMELAMLYKQQGSYDLALELLQGVYDLNPAEDELGCRYEILALHALKSDLQAAEAFYVSLGEDSLALQIPLLVLNILNNQEERTRELFNEMKGKSADFALFCQSPVFPLEQVMQPPVFEEYRPNSLDAINMAFHTIFGLVLVAQQQIQGRLFQLYTQDERPVTSLDFLTRAQQDILADYGLDYVSDFGDWTEAELLALEGIGQASIKKLKEIGVSFRPE